MPVFVMIFLCVLLSDVLKLSCYSSSTREYQAIYSIPAKEQWEAWKQRNDKVYGSADEEELRRTIWMKHYELYMEHMADTERQFDMEMSEFSDQILARRKLPLTPSSTRRDVVDYRKKVGNQKDDIGDHLRFAPTSWDWRDHGKVTPVVNQGMVNNVVSIVATETVESYSAIIYGNLTRLSFAETKQCCVPEPILTTKIFTCIHDIGGLCSADSYPSSQGGCRNDSCTPVGTLNGARQSPTGDEQALLYAVVVFPVMAGIDASHSSFQMYKSGVYSEPECSQLNINHVVQIVGFGSTKDGKDFWICKNSWGTTWGMDGYILIARNQGNMCGIASQAYVPA